LQPAATAALQALGEQVLATLDTAADKVNATRDRLAELATRATR
jgi:hypothetical protein